MEVFVILGIVIIYFLPAIIGFNNRNANAIFILNLFLGWTFIGWVIALVWAFTTDKKEKEKVKPSKFDELTKLKELLDNGTLNEAEYKSQKTKILQKQ